MRNDLDELKENERQLDNLIDKIKIINNRQSDSKMAFVTCQDLYNIDMYKDQMVMVVKAPAESQLILMDGDPPPVIFKSEKDEIDIFFCPDPSSGEMQKAAATLKKLESDTDDDEASTSTRPHRKAASSTASAHKRKTLGSAQRNLSKAFEDMIPVNSKSKNNLFSAFNATVCRESSNDGTNTNEDTDDDDEVSSTKPFKSTTITTKDLLLLSEPSSEEASSFGMKKDVKMSLFSPQKSWQDLSDMANLSPGYSFTHADDSTGFFAIEPDAEYNFMLADTEGVMDLFDYKI